MSNARPFRLILQPIMIFTRALAGEVHDKLLIITNTGGSAEVHTMDDPPLFGETLITCTNKLPTPRGWVPGDRVDWKYILSYVTTPLNKHRLQKYALLDRDTYLCTGYPTWHTMPTKMRKAEKLGDTWNLTNL